jgi:hypothetical protein
VVSADDLDIKTVILTKRLKCVQITRSFFKVGFNQVARIDQVIIRAER